MQMKTKNYLWRLLNVMVVAMMCVGFTACGGDDDDDPISRDNETTEGGVTINQAIVGTWRDNWNSTNSFIELTFNADGTGKAWWYNETDEFTDDIKDKFTYSIVTENNEHTLIIFWESQKNVGTTAKLKIEGNKMYTDLYAAASEFTKKP